MQAARGAPLTPDEAPDGSARLDASTGDATSGGDASTSDATSGGGASGDHTSAAPTSGGAPSGDHTSAAPTSGGAPSGPRRTGLLLAVAFVVLAADVLTKVLVVAVLEGQAPVRLLGGHLLLQVSRNAGAAFSFAQGATAVFTVIAVAVVVVILRMARRLRSTGWAVALGLLLGGASGNLVDRLLRAPAPGRGAVVDFIDFSVWPSFNVADSGIVVGALLAVLLTFRGVEVDGTSSRSRPGDGPAAHPSQ